MTSVAGFTKHTKLVGWVLFFGPGGFGREEHEDHEGHEELHSAGTSCGMDGDLVETVTQVARVAARRCRLVPASMR